MLWRSTTTCSGRSPRSSSSTTGGRARPTSWPWASARPSISSAAPNRAGDPMTRTAAVLAASLFGLALGEELWQAYMPASLAALGASGVVIGVFGSCRDLLDSIYQYPGGWLADRVGRRRALLIFTALATAGYATYLAARSWPIVLAGLFRVMARKAGAFPTTFARIGDSLPPHPPAVALAVHSVLA